jgi:TrfA protein
MKPVGDILDTITDPGLRERAASLREAMERNPRRDWEEEPKPQTAKIIQLPLWPEPKRGVPNSTLRGALFAAIQGKDRQYLKGELLDVQQGIEIRFTGMQLDQSDLDVWEQALHLARQHPLGTRCHFTAHSFLKALGRRTSGRDHEWLKDVFRRLAGAVVEITHNRMTYFGSMIEGGVRDEDTGQYVLEINPKIIALYAAGWTATDWEQRQALKRKPLALWLHGFYSSHANPHPLTVEYLHKLSGSRNRNIRDFKQQLWKAHEDLQEVGAIRDFEIEGNLVSVDTVPSRSQQKHIRKVRPRRK